MEKVRILYIVSTLKRCGPTNQLFNIVSNLDPDRLTAKIVTVSGESRDALKHKFDNNGINVESLALGRIEGLFWAFGKLKRTIEEFRPDVIHTQGIRADDFAVKLANQ